MKKRPFLVFLSALTTFTLTFGGAGQLLLAQSNGSEQQGQTASPANIPVTPSVTEEKSMNSSSSAIDAHREKRMEFLNHIKDELQIAQKNYAGVNSGIRDTESKLSDIHEETTTLNEQLHNLDTQIENASRLVENVLIQITEKENTLKQLTVDVATKNLEIENQKQMLMDYLKVLYNQENAIADTAHNNETVNIMKLMLSDESVGETLQELKYFKILEANGHEIFDKLENLINEQETAQKKIENTKDKLNGLYDQLSQEKQNIEVQRGAKNQLLLETQGQEKIYQQLLEESKREQAQALQDIQSLRDNLEFIKQKISEQGDKFNPDQYKDIFNKETTSVYDYMKSTEGVLDFQPRWPVSPNRGISAYYHDASYRRAMGMEHQAVDIPTPQGTPLHAPADGVVYKTRDNGYGYSYIILAHAGGFMTLYGHVSDIRVIEGQKMKEGEVIGLSGAMPGTKGAGLMTTGPHLHLEMMKGGTHVDPLNYLPLSYLPLHSLPEKYLGRAMGEQTKIKRVNGENSSFQNDEELVKISDSSGKTETAPNGNSN